jgi:hypothetical protein
VWPRAVRPRVVRWEADSWGRKLSAWRLTVRQARAVIPWNPPSAQPCTGVPAPWSAEEVGTRSSSERLVGRVVVCGRLQRAAVLGWSAVETRVALTAAADGGITRAAWQAGRPELIRSPRLVLAHVWERLE